MSSIDEYEFRASENRIIDQFVAIMKFISIALVIAGVITIGQSASISWAPTTLLSGITWLLMGISLYFPTDNFRKVIDTERNDISELMRGLNELKIGLMITFVILLANRLIMVLDLFRIIG